MVMSMTSIVQTTNFNILLNSFKSTPVSEADSPDAIILRVLRRGIMPLADLAAKTDLSRDAIVEAVNRLRERRQVEILDQASEGDQRKFIRLAAP
jgi:biotin operon repressor